ncbi:MAG: TIGR03790 family protein [Sedimentisphaerales bacterium]|nr:TIGR03790 family protein [Sedimentisphaerales bacterium]
MRLRIIRPIGVHVLAITFRVSFVWLVALLWGGSAFGLEPNEILVIVNRNMSDSSRVGRYYCEKRNVPYENILYLHLDKRLIEGMSRKAYEEQIAEPVRRELVGKRTLGQIRCLLTTYGVPTKIGQREPLQGREEELKRLEQSFKQQEERIKRLKLSDSGNKAKAEDELKQSKQMLAMLKQQIDYIKGRETNASVDSELSMVLAGHYELYRWQPNKLKGNTSGLDFETLMVSRLDGPGCEIAMGLVDKALKAEKAGLKGVAHVDSRGLKNDKFGSYGYYDQSLRDMAMLTGVLTEMPVKEERTGELFTPGACPNTAIYCGWYSNGKYVDAFDFVDGAVGYHIASSEATKLHDPNGTQWCTAMLRDGITATLGPVAEPYLHSFPEPKLFFAELYKGTCLVEAYYRTKPFNSWMLLLIGDPLYRPFSKH